MNNDQSSETHVGPCSNGLFTLYTANDFPIFPEMACLIDDILPSTGLASIFGPSGVGKSFICLDLALSVATGSPWFGHLTNQCNVVYLALEGQAGFRRRVLAWSKHREISIPNNMRFFFDQFAIDNALHRQGLKNVIELCGGAGLIIIDTLNKATPGLDENSSSDMGRIIDAASAIRVATGALVLLVHHSGKDVSRGLRGHSSLHAALDTVIETEKDGQLTRWNLVKSKDGEGGISHSFDLVVVELENDESGKVIKSCAVQEVEGITSCRKPIEPTGKHQKAALSAVQEILVQQRMQNQTESPDCPEGIPFEQLLLEIKDSIDSDPKHRQSRAKDALEALIRQGYLVVKQGLLSLPQN